MFNIVCLGICLLILFCLVAICSRHKQAVIREHFPPISDEEFLARCTPGTRPEVALTVRRIVAEQLGFEYERIYPSSRFVEDLGAD